MRDAMLLVAETNTSAAVTLLVVGILVVFGALIVLAMVIAGLGRLATGRAVAPAKVDGPEPMDGAAGGIDPRHVVVIAAAVAAAVRGPARVHRIVMLGREGGRPWVTEGRVIVMGSHRPGR